MTTYFLMYLIINLGPGKDHYEYTTWLEIRGAPKTSITQTLKRLENGKWQYQRQNKGDPDIEFELIGTVFKVKEGDKIVNVDISEELDAATKNKIQKIGPRKPEGGPEGTNLELVEFTNKAAREI